MAAGGRTNSSAFPLRLGSSSGPGVSLPSSLDSSLEKTIWGFFFLSIRCRVVRRDGSGLTKLLSMAAED